MPKANNFEVPGCQRQGRLGQALSGFVRLVVSRAQMADWPVDEATECTFPFDWDGIMIIISAARIKVDPDGDDVGPRLKCACVA